jgi:hypothetical protein
MKKIVSLVAGFGLFAVLSIAQSARAAELAGKVLETMDAGGYTYVLVDAGTNQFWAASVQFPVRTNDTVKVRDAMPMKDFQSKTLKRKFPMIYFAGSIAVDGAKPAAGALPPGHPVIGGGAGNGLPPNHPPLPEKPVVDLNDFSAVKPAKGGKTVAEIYATGSQLAGQSVTLRGKVMKYNEGILARNWLHLQDGTGKTGSNDLLVTSTNSARLGDVVLVTGKVALNRDFGAGYKYKLIVEDAAVVVE